MTSDPRRRQKKLAKKAGKRKEKKHELVRQKSQSLGQRLELAASAPVLTCWRQEDLFKIGMGHVMFSRQLPDGTVAFGLFLVDAFCLGVKDAMSGIIGRFEFDSRFAPYKLPYKTQAMDAATTRHLVEGAVEYARTLGFAPHPDYLKACRIFGDVDPRQSREEFTFGQEGKPHFMSGPYDTPQRCRHILNTLEQKCGRGNFGFTVRSLEDIPEALQGDAELLEAPFRERLEDRE